MSLVTQVSSALTRIGTEFKAIRTLISGSGTGDVSGLTTTATDLVGAINELDAAGGAGTDLSTSRDATSVTVASNTGTDAVIPAADANAGIMTAADRTKLNGVEALADVTDAGNIGSSLNGATAKTTPVGADILALGDSAASFALKKITATNFATFITNLIVDGSPGTLDTLNELAAAIGDDANFAATVTAALAGKQPLDTDLTAIAALTSAADKVPYSTGAGTWTLADFTSFARTLVANANAADARADLSVYSQAEIGDPATDFVVVFEAAIA